MCAKTGLNRKGSCGPSDGLDVAHHLKGHVTAGDGSLGTGCMETGFTWMDRSLGKCVRERLGQF